MKEFSRLLRDQRSSTIIIAEAGVNHNGSVEMAHQLVNIAAEAGADAVKFQTFRSERLVSLSTPKAEYQRQRTGAEETQYEMLKQLELTQEAHEDLFNYCQEKDIHFLSTPFDRDSADLLETLGVEAFKVGSGDITNWSFLEHIAVKGKPIIISTGMSYLSEVDEAIRVVRRAGNDNLVILHCVSNYPAEPEDVNLRAMVTMANALKVPVGYSDHTLGIEIAIAAVAMGACVIEKHFTLDRQLPGPDHQASLEPDEFQQLVTGIRQVEKALGNGIKAPVESEGPNRELVRRSLIAKCIIPAGTIITHEMLGALRPADGLSPANVHSVVGRIARITLDPGHKITWKDLE